MFHNFYTLIARTRETELMFSKFTAASCGLKSHTFFSEQKSNIILSYMTSCAINSIRLLSSLLTNGAAGAQSPILRWRLTDELKIIQEIGRSLT
jgi:hypothetical protein